MTRTTKRVVVTTGLAVVLAGGAGVAAAAGGSDDAEHALTGTDLDRASAAALSQTGGGRVTGTEVGDEESLYEVEVTLDGGRQVDVQLDKDFHVVSSSSDVEEAGDQARDDAGDE
jgi:ABC-type transporter Mla subunit MlaD